MHNFLEIEALKLRAQFENDSAKVDWTIVSFVSYIFRDVLR